MSKGKIPESKAIIKKDLPFDQEVSRMLNKGAAALTLPAPEKMTDEQIGKFVADKLGELAIFSEKLKPYYLNLRDRFAKKKSKSATIYGCRTWDEYCSKVLDRTKRAVNYFLAGGNPGTHPHQATTSKAPGGKEFPTQTVSVQMVECKPEPPTTVFVEMQSPQPKPEPAQLDGPFPSILEARAAAWLGDVLSRFEKGNFGEADPLLMPTFSAADIQILLNCKDWMERILRAGSPRK